MTVKGMFSIIIPAHKLFKRKDGRYEVEAAVDSVLDQDYKNYEIIVCANGPDAMQVREFIQKRYKAVVKVVVSDQPNAAIARNVGAKIANGEYFSFLSSDCALYPGILRVWKGYFDKNPDVSFLWGDFDIVEEGELKGRAHTYKAPGITTEYDRYLLECFNFFDGAMPLRSKVFKEWNPDVPSLQDWNFILSVTDDPAVKGMRIEDVSYQSEHPKEGGLSYYQNDHWIELQKQIRGLHNIPMRKVCVTSLGAPFHAIRLAKILNADFLPMPSYKPHEYDVVYLLGYYCGGDGARRHNAVFTNNKNPNCLRVIHWIGTDIMQMMGISWEYNYNLVEALNTAIDIQFVEYEYTKSELEAMRVKPVVLPLPLDIKQYKPFTTKPKTYTVAIYTPNGDQSTQIKYNMPLMFSIAKSCPDINFIFFGGDWGDKIDAPKAPNIEYRNWCDIKDVARDSNLLLRITIHDGLPIGPIEFLLCGRDAMISAPGVEGTYWVGSGRITENTFDRRKTEIIAQLRKIKNKEMSKTHRKKIIKFWKDAVSPEKFTKTFNELVAKRYKEVTKKIEEQKKKDVKKT